MLHSRKWARRTCAAGLVALVATVLAVAAYGDQRPVSTRARIDAIERELQDIKDQVAKGQESPDVMRRLDDLEKAVAEIKAQGGGKAAAPKASWADKVKVSGYAQVRWENDPDVTSGPHNKFMVRRSRPHIDGIINDRAGATLELDASENGVVLTDAFGYYKLDAPGDFTLFAGQRTVPFGLDTVRSDSVRVTLEKIEIIRRMIPDDRDLGAWVQYSPADKRQMFATMKSKFGGEGDYGMFTVGVYNGQGRDKPAQLTNKHFSARFAYPFMIGSRYAEAGASWFSGKFMNDVGKSNLVTDDSLHGVHFFLPPQPFGFEAEYYKGQGGGSDVDGWGVQGSYKDRNANTFFIRRDIYNGFKKDTAAAPKLNDFRRTSFGVAHDFDPNVRLSLEYDRGERRTAAGGPLNDDNLWGAQMLFKF